MEKKKNHSLPYFDMQFFTSSLNTTLVLLLLGMVLFFVLTANTLSDYVRENFGFTVVLSDGMKATEVKAFQKRLDQSPFAKEAFYISKEDALKEQVEAMGIDPQEFLKDNPFRASFEIKLHSAYANSDSIAHIEAGLLKDKNVLEVLYRQELIDDVNSNIGKISFFLLCVAGVLMCISFVLISNTIRLAIYSKRFLIHTMKLVGASWGFIRKPFLVKNFWIGVTAGCLADALLLAAAHLSLRYEPALSTIITKEVVLIVAGFVPLFGVLITLLCAHISINKYLRVKTETLYYM